MVLHPWTDVLVGTPVKVLSDGIASQDYFPPTVRDVSRIHPWSRSQARISPDRDSKIVKAASKVVIIVAT